MTTLVPRPLHDSVWLLFTLGGRQVGDFYVPSDDPAEWMDATVVAAGPEVPESLGVGVGDVVVANLFDGPPVFVDGCPPLRNIPASKLLAVIEP